MYDIAGKVALVTGGAKGIGAAYTAALINEGAKGYRQREYEQTSALHMLDGKTLVVVVDRDEASGLQLVNRLNRDAGQDVALYVKCDVTDCISFKGSFDAAVRVYGGIDILINNAGTVDETDGGWRKTVDLNLISVIEGCRLAIDNYLKPGSVIVNTSSIAAVRDSTFPIYSATKAGVSTFSRSLGAPRPYDVTKVRIMAIQPGYTPTSLATANLSELAWIKTDQPDDSLKSRLENVHPAQSTSDVAKCLIDVLKNGESGSVWTVVAGKWKEEHLPHREY